MHSIAIPPHQEEVQEHAIPRWKKILRSPLWLCLLVGIIVRIFLILHGSSALPGDEALTGIQAENILRGLHPIYYYDQPYMGSLEAYILALFFAVAGPSVLVLRIGMTCISLSLVVLTWFFSSALADQAKLKGSVKSIFMIVATLIAALPPLYDVVIELRSWGGYVEAMISMLWIMLAGLQLTQRWQAQASRFELTWRWLWLGFLIGFGFWIDPLVVYAVVAVALWIGGIILVGLLHPVERPDARRKLLLETLLAFATIPSAVIGFIPGIIYGFRHNWTNVTYVIHNGAGQPSSLHMKLQLAKIYSTCTAARVIGGSVPTAPDVKIGHSGVLTAGLVINGICIALAIIAILASIFWRHPVVVRARELTLLPLIFMVITSVVFCFSSIVALETPITPCMQLDQTGRYAVPLTIALPFFLAAMMALLWQATVPSSGRTESQTNADDQMVAGRVPQNKTARNVRLPIKIAILLVLVIYFSTQFTAYATSYPPTVFKSAACIKILPDETPLVQYMRQNGIRYAFATGWVADPITFVTNGEIIASEPPPKGRIHTESAAIAQSDHYAFLFFVHTSDTHFGFQKILDKHHLQYTAKRFPSQPGWDVLIVNPKQKISFKDPLIDKYLHSTIYGGC
ncbi:hypothetical protein KDA_26860 [Dictyobacter alpinus]|uniref:Glycosyltransferase RgtA/B/C/D-like domain-containing protein n=1 Tax=Dictyobacter alpinus TaxID=2014873 RepID=A0A402B7A7_9CHLR|nr:hypothetical protein [Dictyobacter alpinus]GCE27202.1 hypothetical protein KDA_26860 [Dictyobacter alpinus]